MIKTILLNAMVLFSIVQHVYADPNWPPADYLSENKLSEQSGNLQQAGDCIPQRGRSRDRSMVQQDYRLAPLPAQQFAAYGYNPYQPQRHAYATSVNRSYGYQPLRAAPYALPYQNILAPYDPYGMSSMYPIPVAMMPTTTWTPQLFNGVLPGTNYSGGLPLTNPWLGLPW